MSNAASTEVVERARRRIARRILPYLFLLYTVAYLDRVNLGYAALDMNRELGFGPEVYGFGAGIFFAGYFLLEIPGTILVERWSARAWMSRIMISWGLVAVWMGFIHTAHQFYWARFLLGAAEAGFFPGMIVYLSHWFRDSDRAKATAMFVAAQPIANMVGAPISGALLGVHWFGLDGWRWICGALAQEQQARRREHDISAWKSVRHPAVAQLTAAYFFFNICVYGFTFWAPTVIKQVSGSSNLGVAWLAALPYAAGLGGALLVGWSSDRTGERRAHTAACMVLAGVGLGLSVRSQSAPAMMIAFFCLAAVGMYGYQPGFWSLPSRLLTGTAAAASIGLINSVGNLGGFAGPYAVGYLTRTTHSYVAGVLCLAGAAMVAALLIFFWHGDRKVSGF
jgi:ACS family tartrate transporter-like MFS transporter